MEQGVTRVSSNLCSTLNAEHMQARVLIRNMFWQPLEARLIKWKLRLLLKNDVKHTFYLDHYGRKWLALEFTEVCSNNRPWYIRGKFSTWRGGCLTSVIWTQSISLLYGRGCLGFLLGRRRKLLSRCLLNT